MAREFEELIESQVQCISHLIRDPRNLRRRNGRLSKDALSKVKVRVTELYYSVEKRMAHRREFEINYNYFLMNVYVRCKEKYIDAVQLVNDWEPNRMHFTQKLHQRIEELDKHFKMLSFIKLISSSAEVSGTIIGELLVGPEFGWDRKVLQLAYSFGICGAFCSTVELAQTKEILLWASKFIEDDRVHLGPFVHWFRDEEMDNKIIHLFPKSMNMEIVQEVQKLQHSGSPTINIFMSALISNLQEDNQLPQNIDFLCRLCLFAKSNLARLWWNRIAQRRCAVIQHFNSLFTLLGDSVSQMKSMVSQSIPAIVVEQQRFAHIPVEKRIMLNLISMYNSYMNLKHDSKSEISSRLKRLKENMIEEWDEFEQIKLVMNNY